MAMVTDLPRSTGAFYDIRTEEDQVTAANK